MDLNRKTITAILLIDGRYTACQQSCIWPDSWKNTPVADGAACFIMARATFSALIER